MSRVRVVGSGRSMASSLSVTPSAPPRRGCGCGERRGRIASQGQRGVERLSAASGVTKYYYFGSQRVAMQTASGITYLHADHLGSTSVTSGAVSSTQVYYPYGGIRAMTGSAPTDYGFTGQRLDSSSALMYYGARYYDPALGRFIQADTIVPSIGNPQTLNRYAYVNNNPLKHTDPNGHCLEDGCIGEIALVIAVSEVVEAEGPAVEEFISEEGPQLDEAVSQFVAEEGPRLASEGEQLLNSAQQALTNLEENAGSLEAAGPAAEQSVVEANRVQQGLERLQNAASNPRMWNPFRLGARAALERARYWLAQGRLKGVEVTLENNKRIDLELTSSDPSEKLAVEVKYWSQEYALGHLDKLRDQLLSYQSQGYRLILEMFQTKTNPITAEQWQRILNYLRDEGLNLSDQSQLLPTP